MFLEEIVKIKKEEVSRRKALLPQRELEDTIAGLPPPRNMLDAISRHGPMAVIAEIKRASPSVGVIKEEVDLCQLAREYEAGGACAVSVLTESHFFKGDLSYLHRVKKEISLPVLQKDFVLDPFQIYEGRASGSRCHSAHRCPARSRAAQGFCRSGAGPSNDSSRGDP